MKAARAMSLPNFQRAPMLSNLITRRSMLSQMTGVGIDNVSNEHRFIQPDDGDAVALDYACLGADEHSVLAGCQI